MAPVVASADAEAVSRAAELLRAGEVVAVPTESSYGLAALALDANAVRHVQQVKGRDAAQTISVLVADEAMLGEVVERMPPGARELCAAHWPGPLTLVLPGRAGLPEALRNPEGGVGVRVSPDPVAAALLRAVGAPLTATSANRSGEPAATTAQAAALPGVALVLDDGPRTAAASTVAEVLEAPTGGDIASGVGAGERSSDGDAAGPAVLEVDVGDGVVARVRVLRPGPVRF